MTTLEACTIQLAALLEAENAALERMDMVAVAALTSEKNRLVELLRGSGGLSPAADAVAMGRRMRDLSRAADENKLLLERAMLVQRRLMAIVAATVRGPVTGYGSGGAAMTASVKPRAILARA